MPVEGDRPLAADMAANMAAEGAGRPKHSCWTVQDWCSVGMEPVQISRVVEQQCPSLLFLELANRSGPFGRQAGWFLNLYPSRATWPQPLLRSTLFQLLRTSSS